MEKWTEQHRIFFYGNVYEINCTRNQHILSNSSWIRQSGQAGVAGLRSNEIGFNTIFISCQPCPDSACSLILTLCSYSLPSQHLRLIVSCWLTTRARVSPRLIFKKIQNPFSCISHFFEPREPKNGYFHLDLKADMFTIIILWYKWEVRYGLHLNTSQGIVREARDMACFPFEGTCSLSTIF